MIQFLTLDFQGCSYLSNMSNLNHINVFLYNSRLRVRKTKILTIHQLDKVRNGQIKEKKEEEKRMARRILLLDDISKNDTKITKNVSRKFHQKILDSIVSNYNAERFNRDEASLHGTLVAVYKQIGENV